MFLLDWYEQLLMIRENYTKPRICESCETLRSQLATANHEKQILLSRIMEKPEKEVERTVAPPMQHVKPSLAMPWRVRQQMLEANDREKARAMRDAPKPDAKEIEEFEREVKDAERARETSTGSTT
jgi:hypothetical protein